MGILQADICTPEFRINSCRGNSCTMIAGSESTDMVVRKPLVTGFSQQKPGIGINDGELCSKIYSGENGCLTKGIFSNIALFHLVQYQRRPYSNTCHTLAPWMIQILETNGAAN